jgi:hypothetical protein
MRHEPEIVEALRALTGLAKAGAGLLPGRAGKVAGLLVPGLSLVADLVARGFEPAAVIERIRLDEQALRDTDRRWERALEQRFGEAPDPYED